MPPGWRSRRSKRPRICVWAALTSCRFVGQHSYHSERILSRSRALAPLAPLAGMHHERLDGSGYQRQATAPSISVGARVIVAAAADQAKTQVRPHRPGLAPDAAAAELDAGAG